MASWTDDYTRSRTIGDIPYEIDDIIGRQSGVDTATTTAIVASGTVTLLPETPLGRRNYIQVVNTGAVDIAIVTSISGVAADGIVVASSGGTWEDSTSAPLYVVSTGANSAVTVYERATR